MDSGEEGEREGRAELHHEGLFFLHFSGGGMEERETKGKEGRGGKRRERERRGRKMKGKEKKGKGKEG